MLEICIFFAGANVIKVRARALSSFAELFSVRARYGEIALSFGIIALKSVYIHCVYGERYPNGIFMYLECFMNIEILFSVIEWLGNFYCIIIIN